MKRLANAVFQLDSQISGVQWAINSINAQLQRKQEDLIRLKKALSQLLDCSDGFHHNKDVCLDPSLSKNTWSGSMADDFNGFKHKQLQGSYQSIENRDLQTTISRVETEIEQIKQEIISLENDRSSQQSRLNDLHDQRREELLK